MRYRVTVRDGSFDLKQIASREVSGSLNVGKIFARHGWRKEK
jgi:hypothetical protein